MRQPDVSILFPIRQAFANYPKGLAETCLEWALFHQGCWHEVVIVDNASTDGTRQWLTEYKRRHGDLIQLHFNETDLGFAESMNIAASLARGRYFIFQSARSYYHPGAIERFVKTLDEDEDIGFVYGQTEYHGQGARVHVPGPFRPERVTEHFDSLFGYMYRREAVDAGCRYEWLLEREGERLCLSDWDFQIQMVARLGWQGKCLPDQLALHYHYTGEKQNTSLIHKYWHELHPLLERKWSDEAHRVAG